MRITIDMTEAESRSLTINRQVAGDQTSGQAAAQEAAAADAGPPPEALVLALGAKSAAAEEITTRGGDTDAGKPSLWLLDGIAGSRSPD